jgi:glycosyltransferase involved in cell wall biosynthesis
MKICLITNLYEPYSRGGAENIVKITAQALAKDHEVSIITTQPFQGIKTLRPTQKVQDKIKIFRFFPLNIFYYLNDYKHNAIIRLIWHFFDVFNLHSRQVVKKILQTEQHDLVITHNLKGIGYLIPRLIKKLRLKHVHIIHDVQYAVPSGIIIKGQEDSFVVNGFLTKQYQKLCCFLFNKVDLLISPSKWLLDFYTKKSYFKTAKKQVLPNPIKLETIDESRNKESRETPNQFLFLGQIEKHKGIEFLLEVFEKLPELQLNVVGSGSQIQRLKEKYGNLNNICFQGKVDHSALNTIFAQTDFLVIPSLCYENSPTVIYEGYSFGVPVIAANIGGIAELIEQGRTGFTFTAGDQESLVSVLKQAQTLTNWQEMNHKCLNKVKQYNIDQYINKLIHLSTL